MAFIIEKALPEDLPILIKLESHFPSDLISSRQLRYHIKNPRALLLVARRTKEDPAAGYALFLVRKGGFARFYSLIVDPEMQGRGLGRQLCVTAMDALSMQGCKTVTLEVDQADARAVALYRSLGFAEIAVLERYYEDGRHALKMKKNLKPVA